MTESLTLLRWKRRNRKRRGDGDWSLWHIKGASLENRYGRLGCGRRYPRSAMIEEREVAGMPDDDETCAACLMAFESEPV